MLHNTAISSSLTSRKTPNCYSTTRPKLRASPGPALRVSRDMYCSQGTTPSQGRTGGDGQSVWLGGMGTWWPNAAASHFYWLSQPAPDRTRGRLPPLPCWFIVPSDFPCCPLHCSSFVPHPVTPHAGPHCPPLHPTHSNKLTF
jgi:hypothetical protein